MPRAGGLSAPEAGAVDEETVWTTRGKPPPASQNLDKAAALVADPAYVTDPTLPFRTSALRARSPRAAVLAPSGIRRGYPGGRGYPQSPVTGTLRNQTRMGLQVDPMRRGSVQGLCRSLAPQACREKKKRSAEYEGRDERRRTSRSESSWIFKTPKSVMS